jgi:hypothetical protein
MKYELGCGRRSSVPVPTNIVKGYEYRFYKVSNLFLEQVV